MGDKPQIFLSYAREDTKKVIGLRRKLEAIGFTVWVDTGRKHPASRQQQNNIDPGEEWNERIRGAIFESDFFLVCVSKTYISKKSIPIQNELKLAFQLRKPKTPHARFLIPVLLEDYPLPAKLRPYQAVDYYKTKGFEKLKQLLLDWQAEKKDGGFGIGRSPFRIFAELVVPKHTECRVHVVIQFHPENRLTEVNGEKVRELEQRLEVSLPVVDSISSKKRSGEIYRKSRYKPIGLLFPGDLIFSNGEGFWAYSPWSVEDADVLIGQDLLDQMKLTRQGGTFVVTQKKNRR